MNNPDHMPWELKGLQYDNQQKGMGKYSLCKECNNNTGTWYGQAYVDFTHIIFSALNRERPDNANVIIIKDIFPLRIIKQVISMFCSINNIESDELAELRQFVIDKNKVGLDKNKFKLCMYFTESTLTKYAPISIAFRKKDNGIEALVFSEITANPLGFVLYFNPTEFKEYEGIDITGFADFEYNEQAEIEFPLCILEMNDILPLHYRAKAEIQQTIQNNKNWKKEHETDDDV